MEFFLLSLLSPEITLCMLTLSVLFMDLLGLRKENVEKRHRMLGLVVFFMLLAILWLYLFPFIRSYFFPVKGDIYQSHEILNLGHGAFVHSWINVFFKAVIVVLGAIVVLIGLETPYSSHVGEYYSLTLFSMLGMIFLISSEDLVMIFISLELISIALYALTAFQKGARRSIEGGLKYFIFGGLSSAFLLFGFSYIFGATQHTGLKEIAFSLQDPNTTVPAKILLMGILFSLVGLGFKIAAVPFHFWAPDAYEGSPSPVTALIATGSKVASFVALTKVLLIGLVGVAGTAFGTPAEWKTGWTGIVAIIASLSMLIGNIAAINQRNVKRLLAYSSIAHAGYILVAVVAVNANGMVAPLSPASIYFYIVIYALTNVGAFGAINALASRVGGDDFEHFAGIARRAPYLSLLLLLFLLSLAGIPPLAGFFGKFYLFATAIQADPKNLGLLWLVALAIIMSAVSLYYYLVLAKQMYVLPSTDPRPIASSWHIKLTLGLVGLMVLLLGIFPSKVISLFHEKNSISISQNQLSMDR